MIFPAQNPKFPTGSPAISASSEEDSAASAAAASRVASVSDVLKRQMYVEWMGFPHFNMENVWVSNIS
jgi:hypothetical protein